MLFSCPRHAAISFSRSGFANPPHRVRHHQFSYERTSTAPTEFFITLYPRDFFLHRHFIFLPAFLQSALTRSFSLFLLALMEKILDYVCATSSIFAEESFSLGQLGDQSYREQLPLELRPALSFFSTKA